MKNSARIVALGVISILAFAALAIAGAIWFATAVCGFIPQVAALAGEAIRALPSNSSRSFETLDMIVLILLMTPWAALCAWVYWALEGAWLDLLDPRGRELDAAQAQTLKRM